jgi:hypothetical protein
MVFVESAEIRDQMADDREKTTGSEEQSADSRADNRQHSTESRQADQGLLRARACSSSVLERYVYIHQDYFSI